MLTALHEQLDKEMGGRFPWVALFLLALVAFSSAHLIGSVSARYGRN